MGGKRHSDSAYIFEDAASGYGDYFDMRCEKKRRVKDATKVFVPGN